MCKLRNERDIIQASRKLRRSTRPFHHRRSSCTSLYYYPNSFTKNKPSGGVMRRHVWIRFSAIVGSALVLMALLPMAQAQVTWKVDLGAQSKDAAKQALAFLPNEIWIYEGDSITWTSKTDEVHTVTLLKQASGGAPTAGTTRPATAAGCTGGSQGGATAGTPNPSPFNGSSCVNSNIIVDGQSYTISFPAAGNYKFVCLIHRDM